MLVARRRLVTLLMAIVCVATLGSSFGRASERVHDDLMSRDHVREPAPSRRRAASKSVVVVTLDGVRWQDIFEDRRRVPNLQWLMTAEGASLGAPDCGETFGPSGPSFVSLPGYIELMTGRDDHDCTSNDCGVTLVPTLADELHARGARADRDVALFSSWSGIDHAASAAAQSVAVSAGRFGGRGRDLLEHGVLSAAALRASEHAPSTIEGDDFRPDAATAELALSYLRSHDPSFLFIGLGETDEYAHQNDVAGYLTALAAADAIIGRVAELVMQRNAQGTPTTLIITTDHGRAHDFTEHGVRHPESGRGWLVAAGAGIQARGCVASPRARHLADVAPTIRALLDLPQPADAHAGQVLSELLQTSR